MILTLKKDEMKRKGRNEKERAKGKKLYGGKKKI